MTDTIKYSRSKPCFHQRVINIISIAHKPFRLNYLRSILLDKRVSLNTQSYPTSINTKFCEPSTWPTHQRPKTTPVTMLFSTLLRASIGLFNFIICASSIPHIRTSCFWHHPARHQSILHAIQSAQSPARSSYHGVACFLCVIVITAVAIIKIPQTKMIMNYHQAYTHHRPTACAETWLLHYPNCHQMLFLSRFQGHDRTRFQALSSNTEIALNLCSCLICFDSL